LEIRHSWSQHQERYNLFERQSDGLKLSTYDSEGEFSPVEDLQVWRLIPIDLNIQRTRPPLEVLYQRDPRVWRSLSPLWSVPPLLPPLSPTSRGTQTSPSKRESRGFQHRPEFFNKSTNTEESSEDIENIFTSPRSPPSYTPPGSPPLKRTKTTPRLFWRERI